MSPINRFWNLLSIYKQELRQIYVYALFIGLINLTLPLGIQAIVNFLQMGEMTSTWFMLVGFVLFGIVLSGVLQILQLRVLENAQQDLFARSAFEFTYRIPRISFIQLDKIHAPELVNRFFDTLTIQKGVPKILIDFSLASFQIFFGLILLTFYSSYFIILGAVLALMFAVMIRFFGPSGLDASIKESKYKYGMAHWLEEVARLNRTFKVSQHPQFYLEKTDNIISNYLKAREKHFQVLVSQFRFFVGVKIFVASGLLIVGGMLVFREQMNIGQFVAAEIMILLIINSIEKLIKTIDVIYDVLTALDKIGYVTDLPLDKQEGNVTVATNQGLSVQAKEIAFAFPEERRKVIDNLSFQVEANDKVILEGPSGSGKSLLLQLLSGLHKVDDGILYVGGVPISNYQRDAFYDSVAVSFPVNQIFEGTLKENILLGRTIDNRALQEVIELLGLNDFIIHQKDGLESFVDSGGRRLPRGIIQKILVARLIIGEPKLLLMEDPLQFIEEEEKKRIVDYIMHEDRNWTVIVVSDFYYWKEKSNRIIELPKN